MVQGPRVRGPDTVKTGSLVSLRTDPCQQRLVQMCDCRGFVEVSELWRRSLSKGKVRRGPPSLSRVSAEQLPTPLHPPPLSPHVFVSLQLCDG